MPAPRADMRAMVAASVDDHRKPTDRGAGGDRGPSLARMAEGRRRHDAACLIRIDRIAPDPNQPRVEFDPGPLAELAESMHTRGQLQPIRVRWDAEADRYVIVLGERRWRAASMAGLETVACIVADGPSTVDDLLEDQLVENCLREGLKPVEQARAFKTLMERRGLSQQALADRLHMGQASIARALALLELPADVRADVDAGAIPPSIAAELVRISDPEERASTVEAVKSGRMRREDVIERVRGNNRKGRGAKLPRRPKGGPFRYRGSANLTVTVARSRGKAPVAAAEVAAVLREALASVEGDAEESAAA